MRKVAIAFALTFAVAAIALAFIYPHNMIAPGNMVAGHKAIETDCFACHTPFHGAPAAKCISCHAVAEIGRKTTKGVAIVATEGKTPFHQELVEQDCTYCHNDHKAPLGVESHLKHFSHQLLRAETRARCEGCHTRPQDDFHRDLTTNCAQCHKADAWKPATFDHAKFFELDRDHNTACTTCHVGGNFKQYTCYGCHEHRQDKIRSKHQEEGIANFENCVSCHRNAHDEPEHERERD